MPVSEENKKFNPNKGLRNFNNWTIAIIQTMGQLFKCLFLIELKSMTTSEGAELECRKEEMKSLEEPHNYFTYYTLPAMHPINKAALRKDLSSLENKVRGNFWEVDRGKRNEI